VPVTPDPDRPPQPETTARAATAASTFRLIPVPSRALSLLPALAQEQVERWHDEQVEQRGADQATGDDDCHRVLDLLPGDVAGQQERHEGEPGRQRGHEDRRQALLRALDDQLRPEGHAFLVLQVLVVADEHDAVAGDDAEDGEEADERAERDDPTEPVDGDRTADERRRQLRNVSNASRNRLKTTMRSRKIPAAVISEKARSRSCAVWRSLYSPSSSAW
jgi:hypothetical protein